MGIKNKEKIERNFCKAIEYRIKDSWDEPVFQDYESSKIYNYAEVAYEIKKYHFLFKNSGIKKGDKIALVGANSSNWAINFFAVTTYGAVIVPILPDFMPDDIVNLVNHSESKILFLTKNVYSKLNYLNLNDLNLNIVDIDTFDELKSLDSKISNQIKDLDANFTKEFPQGILKDTFELERIDGEELAEISYTSGTSGNSKGVMLSHNNLFMNAIYCIDIDYVLQESDKILAFLPMAHSFGCAFDFLLPFFNSCHATFLTKLPSPQILIKALGEVKPRHLLSVPLVIEKIYFNKLKPTIEKPIIKNLLKVPGINILIKKLIKNKLLKTFGGNLAHIILGGAPLNPEVEEFFKLIDFPFTVGYGMTECGPLITFANPDKFKLKSCGKVIRGMKVRIESSDPHNVPGEIQVKGEHVMLGYYKNEKATKQIITRDGWLRTGDMGILDFENNLFINGRSKSILLGASGQNIYPEEIENIFITNKYILECLAIQEKDSSNITLLVFPDFSLEQDKEHLAKILDTFRQKANNKLAPYMRVKGIKILDVEFEKTPKKTIKRYLYN